jgi:hypothetical protein
METIIKRRAAYMATQQQVIIDKCFSILFGNKGRPFGLFAVTRLLIGSWTGERQTDRLQSDAMCEQVEHVLPADQKTKHDEARLLTSPQSAELIDLRRRVSLLFSRLFGRFRGGWLLGCRNLALWRLEA